MYIEQDAHLGCGASAPLQVQPFQRYIMGRRQTSVPERKFGVLSKNLLKNPDMAFIFPGQLAFPDLKRCETRRNPESTKAARGRTAVQIISKRQYIAAIQNTRTCLSLKRHEDESRSKMSKAARGRAAIPRRQYIAAIQNILKRRETRRTPKI